MSMLSWKLLGRPSLYTPCSSVHGTPPDDATVGRVACVTLPPPAISTSSKNRASGTPVTAPVGTTALSTHTEEPSDWNACGSMVGRGVIVGEPVAAAVTEAPKVGSGVAAVDGVGLSVATKRAPTIHGTVDTPRYAAEGTLYADET